MSGNSVLDMALHYLNNGYCVIPCKVKPFVKDGKRDKEVMFYAKWQEFQEDHPTTDDAYGWWDEDKHPGIAMITGKISGVCVLDVDLKNGKLGMESLKQVLPGMSLEKFHVKTISGGYHLYFAWDEEIRNKVDLLSGGLDFRGDGGLVIVPPTPGYEVINALDRGSLEPIPSKLRTILHSNSQSLTGFNYLRAPARINSDEKSVTKAYSKCNKSAENVTECNGSAEDVLKVAEEGTRDHEIFHLANCLVKGGMDPDRIRKFVYLFAQYCDPPFPQRDAEIKIQSAEKRAVTKYDSTADEIRAWVTGQTGEFSSLSCYGELQIVTKEGKSLVRMTLKRMVEAKELERTGKRSGWYRRPADPAPKIDIFKPREAPLNIVYPLKVEEYFLTLPKNLIVIAGSPDVGKTAYMLRFVAMNHNRCGMPIRYMSSEMGETELRYRLDGFDDMKGGIEFWDGVDFVEASDDYKDHILPNAVNIIDYLEISDNFYQVAGIMRGIYEKLCGGICLIALQKDPKSSTGRGGMFTLEKPRLAINLDSNYPDGNIAKIVKCKNMPPGGVNGKNRECQFTIHNGNSFQIIGGWRRTQK